MTLLCNYIGDNTKCNITLLRFHYLLLVSYNNTFLAFENAYIHHLIVMGPGYV